MVSRREKLSRSYFRLREQTFHKQVAILSLTDLHKNASSTEISALHDANHGPNIYDVTYSRSEASKEGFEQIIQLIGGVQSNAIQLKKVRLFLSFPLNSLYVKNFSGKKWNCTYYNRQC